MFSIYGFFVLAKNHMLVEHKAKINKVLFYVNNYGQYVLDKNVKSTEFYSKFAIYGNFILAKNLQSPILSLQSMAIFYLQKIRMACLTAQHIFKLCILTNK